MAISTEVAFTELLGVQRLPPDLGLLLVMLFPAIATWLPKAIGW